MQEELAKAAMDKEEKIKRMKELKDKRKKEKVEGIRKKQHTDRMRALRIMAEIHYEKNLMAKYGIRPLRILIELKRNNIEKANSHYKFQLKKNIFLNWMWYTEDMWYERNFKAVDFRKKKLLRKSFEALIKVVLLNVEYLQFITLALEAHASCFIIFSEPPRLHVKKASCGRLL